MVRVVVPFTRLTPSTVAALDATGRRWEPVDVSGSDDAYWTLLDRLWRSGGTFVVVEHDVVVRPGTIDELESCPSEWCAFPTVYLAGAHYGLGCCKFAGALTRRIPDALEQVAAISDGAHGPRHWCRIDAWLTTRVLPAAGARMCQHDTILDHPAGRSSHGCI